MFSSRLFWRIFLAYALSLLLAVVFVGMQSGRQRSVVTEQVEQRLHDSAVILRNHLSGAFVDGPSVALQRELQELGAANQTRLTLIASDGTVVGDSAEDPASMEDHSNRPELIEARRVGTGVSQRTSPTLGIAMMYFALRVGDADQPKGFVRVAMLMESVNAEVAALRRLMWGTMATLSLLTLVLTYMIVGRIIRPVAILTQAAQAMAGGDLRQTVDVPRGDELGMLGIAFNRMSSELATRMDELQRNRRDLAENSELLETVLGTMVEGVVAIDRQQNILFANEAARPLLDAGPGSVVGRTLWEVARHPQILEVVQIVLDNSSQMRAEFEIPRTKAAVALLATRLPGDPCPGVVLVLQDVTELRRLENMRRDFVASVSHELKTPLTSIQAYAETLSRGAVDDPEHNRKFLRQIEDQADRLHALILDLLRLAKIESEEEAFELSPVSLTETLEACAAEHATVAESKGVLLATQPADQELRVLADAEELRSLFNNLVDNAINYTQTGGSVTIGWSTDDGLARIDIIDTGIGIPLEHQPRIFERFYRVDKARSREVGGTGLGLSIVKHLAQVFGGTVDVDSEFGKGSTFTVRLPLADASG